MERDTVGRPMEILLIEDSLVSARLTMGALKNGRIEHRLTWLADGNDALEFLHQNGKYGRAPTPDLVLLDLMLPGKNGNEVLADMRSRDDLKDVPVVVMTGTAGDEPGEALQEQVQGYLTKPIDIDKFLSIVERLKDYWKEDMILPAR